MPAIVPHRYSVRVLHIVTGVLLIYGMVRNGRVTNALETPNGILMEVVFALVLGALFIWRYAVVRRQEGGRTRLADTAPVWERRASKFVHAASYILVSGVIVTGLFIALFATINSVVPLRVSIFAHNAFAHALMPVIVIHIAGALWHWLVRRDGIWRAMMSLRKAA